MHCTTDESFDDDVRTVRGPVLVDFWASWCPPCKMMQPVVARLADEYAGRVTIVTLNVDQNPRVAQEFKIDNVPTFMLFEDGTELTRRSGALTVNQLRALIRSGRHANSGT